jgi:hypothetical protein
MNNKRKYNNISEDIDTPISIDNIFYNKKRHNSISEDVESPISIDNIFYNKRKHNNISEDVESPISIDNMFYNKITGTTFVPNLNKRIDYVKRPKIEKNILFQNIIHEDNTIKNDY